MPRMARKFVYDAKAGGVVEATPAERRAVCDEISKGTKAYKQPWLGNRRSRNAGKPQYPYASEPMGCHPEQIAEYKAEAEKKGVPTEFTPDGRPVIRDKKHERQFMKAFNYFHRNGGYSDIAPDNYVESTHSRKAVMARVQSRREEIKHQIAKLEAEIFS